MSGERAEEDNLPQGICARFSTKDVEMGHTLPMYCNDTGTYTSAQGITYFRPAGLQDLDAVHAVRCLQMPVELVA
jgi:hypothetical protein